MSIIDNLLKDVTEPERQVLQHIRELILRTADGAVEVKTYGMAGFKWKSKYLISFAAFKDHMSVFPGAETIAVLEDRLASYQTSKGTIQFTSQNPLPDDLVVDIVKQRMQEIEIAAKPSR